MAPVTKLKTIKYGHLNISVMRILELDEFINEVGQCGLYQLRTQILFAIFMIPLSTQIFMTYFVMHDPPWRCVRNSTICKYRDVIVPQDHVRFTTRCNMPRAEWEFVMPKRYSLVTEFDLVCKKAPYAIAPTSMLFIGWSIGGIAVAYLSDRIGRKRTLFICTMTILISAITAVAAANIFVFIASRFIIGAALAGGPVTIFVLAAEIVGSKHRAVSCTAMWIYYAFALALLAFVAYVVRNWRYLELLNSVPFLLLILSWKYFPESIRWMTVHGKHEEAETLLAEIAKTNRKTVPNAILATPPRVEGNASILRIFHPFSVFVETAIQMMIWFSSGLTYYAVSLASQDLSGRFYTDFVFVSVVEVPANLAIIYLSNKIGRKKTVIIHLYLAVVALITVAFIPLDIENKNPAVRTSRLTAGLIGKYASAVYFNTAYIWSAELIPTVVRNQGVGMLVVTSRIAGMFAPLLVTSLKEIRTELPMFLLAAFNFIAGSLSFFLRETKDAVIFDTMEEKLTSMGIKEDEK